MATVGSTCAVELNDNIWAFVFSRSGEPACTITVETICRLVEGGRVTVTSADHGHLFGLPAPVDAGEETRRALVQKPVLELAVERTTGDLTVGFVGGARVQVLTTSAGYESWQAYFRSDDEDVILVGGGGGDLSWVSSPAGSKPQILRMRPVA